VSISLNPDTVVDTWQRLAAAKILAAGLPEVLAERLGHGR
jgi:hypothetical protein